LEKSAPQAQYEVIDCLIAILLSTER